MAGMMNPYLSNPARPKHAKPPVVQHGVAHSSPATRQIHSLAMGTATGARSTTRRKKKAAAAPRARRASSGKSSSKRARALPMRSGSKRSAASMVKGSAAAKKHMAQLRAMRGKKSGSAG